MIRIGFCLLGLLLALAGCAGNATDGDRHGGFYGGVSVGALHR